MRRCALALLLCAGTALADPVEDAATEVARLHAAGDAEALASLAGRDDPDPWLVADELCTRGAFDAADAFAKASPRKDVERLAEYVSSQRAQPTPTDLRAELERMADAFAEDDAVAALAIAEGGTPGADVVGVRLRFGRGVGREADGRWNEASKKFLEAAAAANRIGWYARGAEALHEAGACAYAGGGASAALAAWEEELEVQRLREHRPGIARALDSIGAAQFALGRYERALESMQASLEIWEALSDPKGIALSLGNMGNVFSRLGDYARALAHLERSLAIEEAANDPVGLGRTLGNLALVHERLGNYRRALAYQERALELKEQTGNRAGAATTLMNIGVLHYRLGDYTAAQDYMNRSLQLAELLQNRRGIATALGGLGGVLHGMGELDRALEIQERVLQLVEEMGDRAGMAATLSNLGGLHQERGDHRRALEYHQRALALEQELRDKSGIALALGNMGLVHVSLGNYEDALDCHERSLALREEMGDPAGAARALRNLAMVHSLLGQYAQALGELERSVTFARRIKNKHEVAATLGNLGLVYEAVGDAEAALDHQQQALALSTEIGDQTGVAQALGNIGMVLGSTGEAARALEYLERSLELSEQIGHKPGIATLLGNIGLLLKDRGEYGRALEHLERSLAIRTEIGDRAGAAATRSNIGIVQQHLGRLADARASAEGALAEAREIGNRKTEVLSLWNLADTHRLANRPREAVRLAHDAVKELPTLVQGLGEERAAQARERWAGVFDLGVAAARLAGDLDEIAFFLESGRAASLLESLGGRETLRAQAVPDALSVLEREARVRETAARRAHARALGAGKLDEIRAKRSELDAARRGLEEVIARIQRDAKAAGNLLYGRVDPLSDIRARLAQGEALLLYGSNLVLVVTRPGARVVPLEDVEPACEARDWSLLEKIAIEPLELGDEIQRVFVSPVGGLAYAPFCVLLPGRDVVYVPSGTVYGQLLENAPPPGDGVLALGDPDYGTRPDAHEFGLLRGGALLGALPATREEARAVGSEVLLGKDATQARLLAELATRPRWRAVHLACHGLVDSERPLRSALALSGGDLWTTLEVYRARVPADLVVLSACETAKGRVYAAEGVVGFVRAFLFAGADRVLVSLWKVDDEATQALMVRFYEEWKTQPAATALRRAQAHVAAQPGWESPEYWAAWQLWGLPD